MEATKLLTNRCVMDERTLQQTYARIFRKTLSLFYFGAGLVAALALLLILLQGGLTPMPLVLLLGAAAYLFVGLRMPKKQARRQIQRYEQSGVPKPEVTVWFGDESLTGRREGVDADTEIDYDSLKAIYPNGSRIILWTVENQFVVLDTARFENGSEADFWKRMQEKCPAALPKEHRAG